MTPDFDRGSKRWGIGFVWITYFAGIFEFLILPVGL